MVISQHQFELLCAEYRLSPTQKQIARLLLDGKTTDAEICQALRKEPANVQKQVRRMGAKMFCRNRTQILWRFWKDSQTLTP